MVPIWITGPTRSGKTQHLIDWLLAQTTVIERPLLVFAANGDNRMVLAQRLAATVQDRVPYTTTTPAGFIQSEVILYWPLLLESLSLRAQFPLKLRPENEQLLALQLWEPLLVSGLQVEGWPDSQTVRRTLDLWQLAASAGIPAEAITQRLQQGMMPNLLPSDIWMAIGDALLQWRAWCLERGLLTYGLMTELYWRSLLPLPQYQTQLLERFAGTAADDVDEYSAIAIPLFQVFKAAGCPQSFTYNPSGQVRLGVGADPAATLTLASDCEIIRLNQPSTDSLGYVMADDVVQWVQDPLAIPELPEPVQLITAATTRGKMLRQTAELIADAVHREVVTPADIAVIGPGLDAIARYSLIEILSKRGIGIASLKDQRPLISSPFVRALLTLLALIYPYLGRLVDRDAVAEMLVVLSQTPETEASLPWFDLTHIDPVRAELIADHCFVPDIEHPRLLPVENFPRWDRLGYQATAAYNRVLDWLGQQKKQQQQRYPANPVIMLDRAVQDFLWRGNYLPSDQLSALRELMETAQYFWDVEQRLALYGGMPGENSLSDVGRFIRLLQRGTVSANPYPARSLDGEPQGVTLATVFQYRAQRLTHRWQFWLDAGSPRWLTGRDELFGAEIFLSDWPERPVTAADTETMHEARLERILRDLLGRTTERLYLCHSELALNGQEQMGPLLGLVSAVEPTVSDGQPVAEQSP